MNLRQALCGWTVVVAVLSCAPSVLATEGQGGKRLAFTTKSPAAQESVVQIVRGIESFKPAPDLQSVARKAIEADPEFAFAHYLLGAVTFPQAQGQPHIDKALELAKNASEGERGYIEGVAYLRGRNLDKALEVFSQLARDYPEERMVQMMLGQISTNQGRLDEAVAAFEKAIQLDGSTPRAHALLGNCLVLKGDYPRARQSYEAALARKAQGTAPGQVHFGLAMTHLYDGDPDAALKALGVFLEEYAKSPNPNLPPVFIWNAMARIHLENGRPEEALKCYEMGYETVPGSSLSEDDKKLWLGRLHHGKGRSLARMGRHEEAWQHAEAIQKMIDEGGERGKQFVPAYHYLAGYLRLERGAHAEAIEHLKQADPSDSFIQLLLGRAYEKAGDPGSARTAYEQVVKSRQNNLDRALAYPEARKKLKT